MAKSLEFFIYEPESALDAIAKKKSSEGAIKVSVSTSVIPALVKRTQSDEDISVGLSGVWLEACITDSVKYLLGESWRAYLDKRHIIGVTVHLNECLAGRDRAMSLEEKRQLLTEKLGEFASDPRLTITP